MVKRISLFFGVLILFMVSSTNIFSQSCDSYIRIDSLSLERNVKSFNLPVTLDNPCPVGGIQVDITTDPAGIIIPVGVDLSGGRIESWELIVVNNNQPDSNRLRFLGIADFPGEPSTPPLDSGNGLLFNVVFNLGCGYEINTQVDIILDSVVITDSSGYENYNVEIGNSIVEIGDDTALRGDANCDGALLGSDVTCLVNYFRGMVSCPCSQRAGDVNDDGYIIGSDVTYLVRYFRGGGPPPPP